MSDTGSRLYRLAPETVRIGQDASICLPDVVDSLGRRSLILGDEGGLDAAESVITSLRAAHPESSVEVCRGECTRDAVQASAARARAYDVVVGVGGGKALDTAKAAADAADRPCITLPTSAATCAAYTPLSILHEASGAYVESLQLRRPIAVCIVDLDLIASAPSRLLAAGIVDALARAFDTILAARIDIPTETAAMSLAVCRRYVHKCLLPRGDRALADNEAGTVTEAFAHVVDACILGAGLAGETGARFFGRGFSHAVAYALSHVVDPEGLLHGEAAGLGILVQCALDPSADVSLESMTAHFTSWGVPSRFREIGIPKIGGNIGRELGERTYEYLDLRRAIPFSVDAARIHHTMVEIDNRALNIRVR